MARSPFDGSGDYVYIPPEDSDSNSERYLYVYSGNGLRSTESLYRPDDGPSRNPVEASDIDSEILPLCSYPEHRGISVWPVDFFENREYFEQVFEQNRLFLCSDLYLTPSRPVTGIHCPSTSSSTSTLSVVSDSGAEGSDFEENTETISGSSSHLITSMYNSTTGSDAEDTRLLASKLRMSERKKICKKGSTTQVSLNPARPLSSMSRTHIGPHSCSCQSKNCRHLTRKHKQRSDIVHPTGDLSLKTSRRKYDCLITYASDATTKLQLAAKYMITRGYNVMTDVSSRAITSYPTLTEQEALKKLEKIFHKCEVVLCFLSEEYVLRIIGKKTKHDQMHIRFFDNLMEEEYKQNVKTNTRFLPIHIGCKYSKMNNIPNYLKSYPKDKCRQFQELVLEAFM